MTDTTSDLVVMDGRYRLGELLGSSGAYEIRRALDTVLQRAVIAKVHTFAPGQESLRRQHEAVVRLTASLSHHNLVPVLDYDVAATAEGGSRMVLIMEAASGRSLRRRLLSGPPLTIRQAAYLGFDLAEALEYLHEHGIVHRGLMPGVVLLAEHDEGSFRAQLADLGTAVRVDRTSSAPVGERLSSYSSPEQLRGDVAGPQNDVYMLGLVVLEALTGRAAFPDPAARSDAEQAPVIPVGLPAPLADLLSRCTAADPADRPSAGLLATEFRKILATEMGRNRKLSPALAERDEEARLAALRQYDLLDTPPEGAFDRVTALAARALDMPVSTVSIVDRDRIWFKSHFGLDGGEVARDPGLCATVVRTGERVYIPDAEADESARGNPLIAGDLGLRSYAGVPLTSVSGYTLGSLSVADYRPRTLTGEQLDTLEQLGTLITHELEMRLATRRAVLSHD